MSKKHKNTQLDVILGQSEDRTGYIGFPPYTQEMFNAVYTVEVELPTELDVEKFVELVGCDSLLEPGLRSLKSFWYPALERGERGSNGNYIWVEEGDE